MKNFEFYEEKIKEIGSMSIAFVDGEILSCSSVHCENCEFSTRNGGEDCEENYINWLYSEHKETPKLTKKERLMCEILESGWIARDYNGSLFYFEEEPWKVFRIWMIEHGNTIKLTLFNTLFSFIKWEDDAPWTVEELLKLEVSE